MILEINLKNHFEAALSVFILTTGYLSLLIYFNFDFGIVMICSIATDATY